MLVSIRLLTKRGRVLYSERAMQCARHKRALLKHTTCRKQQDLQLHLTAIVF